MIISILFVYPRELSGPSEDDVFISQKSKILTHWDEVECPQGNVINCVGVSEDNYRELVRVGLGTQSTSQIMEAIAANVGQTAFQRHVVAMSELAQQAGLGGFTIRFTDINHPNGFPYAAIGFDAS